MLRETFAGGRPVVWQLVSAVQAGAVEQPTCLAQCLSGGNLFVTQCDAGEQKSIPHSGRFHQHSSADFPNALRCTRSLVIIIIRGKDRGCNVT